MITIKLAFKDILHDKMRALSLFFFIFVITITLVLSTNVLGTVESNMQNSIRDCFTGDVIIRSGESTKGEIYSWNIDAVNEVKIKGDDAKKQISVLNDLYSKGDVSGRIRYNGMVSMHLKSEMAMFIGLDANYNAYKESLQLIEGNYLSANEGNGILMTKAIAEALGAKVGETLVVDATAEDGKVISKELKVIGIAEMNSLSFFNIPIIYLNLDDAEKLFGYGKGELTDIVITPNKGGSAQTQINKINDKFNSEGINGSTYTIQKGRELSGYIMDFVTIFSLMFIALIVILFIIIGILVINLIVMIGIQRKTDIGVMKAIGFSKRKIAVIYFCGIMLVSILALLCATLVSFIILSILSNVGITNITGLMRNIFGQNFYPSIKFGNTFTVLITAVVVLGIFSYVPCRKIANLNPVDAFKEN